MDDYVGLNVGGKIYRTSRLTLTRYPDSFFSSLLDGGMPYNKDDKGNYMIDQDGKIFRHVLNFMRYGELELPEGFSELGLLKRQADFFSLPFLKESIEGYVSIGGSIGLMFYDGKLFNTTTETLSKENSFFTKMLKGEVVVSRDSQGNYVMDRDGSVFHHVLNYLRDGGVFNAVTPSELDLLETDAKYFGLKVFSAHIKSIRYMQGKHLMSSTQLHVYFSQNTPCMAYVSSCRGSTSSRASKLPHVNALSPFTKINVLFKKTFTIIDAVKSGVVNTDKINPNGPTGVHDVMDYFKKGVRPQNFPEHEIKNNCIELVFYHVYT